MIRAFGLFLAVLGLVAQLSSGTVAQRSDDAAALIAALASVSVDCHPAPLRSGDRAPHRRHGTEPSLCPAQLALEQSSFTVVSPLALPETTVAVVVQYALVPPARGPPQATARVGEPRAPPVQA